MNKTTYVKKGCVLLLLLLSIQIFGQNFVPFTPRFNQDIKGDIQLIGNNILGPNNNAFNDTAIFNHNVNMVYIDIDNDATTFSSSSADLQVPNPGCYRIIHAGLYWSANTAGPEPFTSVKFKGPSGGYNDVVGTVIFDANGTSVDGGNSFPYACYADVTNIVTALATDLGTYTVANVSSLQGQTGTFTPRNGTGNAAGWSLYIVYEDPTLTGKSITSFDGFSSIFSAGNPTVDIPVTGFRTLPAPAPVRANFAFAALEGDSPIQGDQLLLNGLNLSTADRPANNFFNSTVTQLNALPVNNRNPNSRNTLGFDTGFISVPNPGNTVIANEATSATVRLQTTGDTYFPYFFSLAVDIIEPDIVLTKIVEDAAGNNVGDLEVNLGDELNYVLSFQNIGNDDATNYIIRDILPINVVFNFPQDLGVLPNGVVVQSYDPNTREIIFSIDNNIVKQNDPIQSIRFKVRVVSTCGLLVDACSDIVTNQAFSTYNGTLNQTFTISDDPSFNTVSGCLISPAATNFLADLDCGVVEEVILCGASTVLISGAGYDTYSWSRNPSGTPVIGTGQSLTVTETGRYYVTNTAIAPCQSTDQEFDVVLFGADVTNPVIPFADQVAICVNDGRELPNIFLCGGNGPRRIETNITDTTSIIWEQLDESSCTAVINRDCANEDSACTWNQIETGPNYTADTGGQFRLTLNYDGGCFNQFYFNVYTNELMPTVTSRDIFCTTPGEIVVGNIPSDYEYSIDGTNYQTSNTFSISTPGIYRLFIKQIGVDPNPCIFTVPDVQIRQTDFTVSTVITQPLCNGDLGSVSIAANDVRPQYFFSISQGGTLVNSVGPINPNNYAFDNLNVGTYTIDVSTEDGCVLSEDITIIQPPLLEVTSALTTPLTCQDGEITFYPTGGTPPYFYFINGSTIFQTVETIPVTAPGVFSIRVVDSNNCIAETSLTVGTILPPDFTVVATDITCAENGDVGTITFNVNNPNGNTLQYSIDNGATFSNSNVFTGLAEGTYEALVQYSAGLEECTSNTETVNITTLATVIGAATLTTPYSCISNGVITVSGVSGGTAPYTYSLDGLNFQPGVTFTGLTDGTYTVTIRDANGCVFITAPITIDALNPPTDLDFSSTALSCPAITSDVTITSTTGGTPALEYQITAPVGSITPYQSSTLFAGLSPDTYTFQVRDVDGCTYNETFTIAPLPPITVSTIISKALDCTTSPDGVISGTISGGLAPFTYAVSFNGGTYGSPIAVTGTSFMHTAGLDGTYQFQITDANNCIVESGVQTINPISLPEIISVVQTQPILCNGDSNAAIDITINNTVGTSPFVINVNNDTTNTDFGTQTSGLPAGDYTITLTDGNACEDIDTITIVDPLPIDLSFSVDPISCSVGGVSLGRIIVNSVNGGTPNYIYHVTGVNGYNNRLLNQTGATQVFEVVDFGLYEIIITDANGCSIIEENILVASPPDDLDITINPTADCINGGEATVAVGTSLAGSGPYHFAIYTGPGMIYTAPTAFPWQDETTPGSGQTTFTNLSPGVTYTFIVFDQLTGCYYFETAPMAIPTDSTLTGTAVTSNNITCTGSEDGNVSFDINSVYTVPTNVTYEIFNTLSTTTTTISGTGVVPAGGTLPVNNLGPLPFGEYFVLVNETSGVNAGCSIVTIPFNITQSAILLGVTASVDKNANCNPNSGIISAIATNGTPPYEFQLTTTAVPPPVADPLWNSASTFNANANSYFVHVKDANDCIQSTPVIVLPLDPEPVITAVLNNQCTIAEGNFVIDVNLVTTGIAPYSFSVDGGAFQTRATPFSITNLASGTHTVEIQDANGCGNLVSVDIEAPLQITSADVTQEPTCNNDDGEITVNGSGGSGSYTYSISPNPGTITLTGNVFSNVPPGTYTVTITDAVTACFDDITVILQEAISPTFTAVPNQVTCFGDNDGTIALFLTGYSGAYTYEVFDSTSTSVFGVVNANTSTNPELVSGLLAGTYSIEVTEISAPFCSATTTAIIRSPLAPLSLDANETSNVTCDDGKGTIVAMASGGWGTYEYELTGAVTIAYSPNGTFTDLSAGSYTVNVRDAGGCIVSETIVLLLPTLIDGSISATPTLLSCFGDTNATITVSAVTGGQGSNYTYTLNRLSPTVNTSGPQTSNVFDNLGAGTYNVLITDGFNCDFTTTNVTITQPSPVQANLVKTTSQTCTTQTVLTLSATGGTGLYEYSDTATFATILGTFSTSINIPVTPGTYAYFVRDVNGCLANVSNTITIDPLPVLTVRLDTSNTEINCNGDDNATIIATAEGGLGSYVYTLEDRSGNPISPVTQNSPGVFTNLPVGDYQVQVTSGDCLETSILVPVTNASQPLNVSVNPIDVTCNGENDGMLEITASGGSGVLKYAVSPQLDQFFDIETVENLAPGNYDIIVQDVLGCFVLLNFDIDEPAPLGFSFTIVSEAPCDGDETGEFTIQLIGGEPPYSVSLDDITYIPLPLGTTSYTFTGLEGGEKNVYVLDSENCGGESPFSIPLQAPVILDPIANISYECSNDLVNNTSTVTNRVVVTVDSSITDTSVLEYALDGSSFATGTGVFENLSPGPHSIEVRHPNGCVKITDNAIPFIIETFPPLVLVLEDGGLNEIVAVASGGEAPYEYKLNDGAYGNENTFLIFASGDYTVTVLDANGCETSATRFFEYIDVCIPNYFTPNGDGVLDGWGPGCANQYRNLTFDIFDRYGRKIATLRIGDKWDGRYKGAELPSGDYWYLVKLNEPQDDREFVGNFTLYR